MPSCPLSDPGHRTEFTGRTDPGGGLSRPRSLHGAGLAQSSQAHPPAPTLAEASTSGSPGQISQETKSAGPPGLTSISQRTRQRMQQRTAGCRPHGARVQPASQELRARAPASCPQTRWENVLLPRPEELFSASGGLLRPDGILGSGYSSGLGARISGFQADVPSQLELPLSL